MVVALALIIGGNGGQSAQLDHSTQGIDDAQNKFQSQGGLARLKIDDEAHAHPCRKRQLRLRQPELLAGGTKCSAELLWRSNGRHGAPSFPFG
jgi:hypothetical protein